MEEFFNVKGIILCLKGSNNPRYRWYPCYKQNRPLSLPIIAHLHKYLIDSHDGVETELGETDDFLAEIVSKGQDSIVICGFDKDLKQLSGRSKIGNWYYDYKYDRWDFVTKERAKILFATQWIVNDAGDNIKLCKGCGPKFAEKVIKEGMDDFEYMEGVFKAYMKCHNNKPDIALENMQLAWKLMKLHTFDELKSLEMLK